MEDNLDHAMLVQALRDVIDDPSALLTRLKAHALESRDILHAPVYDAAAELNAEESSFFRAVARAARQGLPKHEITTFMFPAVALCQHGDPPAVVDMLVAFEETWGAPPVDSVHVVSKVFSNIPTLSYACTDMALAGTGSLSKIAPTLAVATAASEGLAAIPYLLNLAESRDVAHAHAGLAGLCAVDADRWPEANVYIDRVMAIATKAISEEGVQHLGYRLLNHISLVDKRVDQLLLDAMNAGNETAQVETVQWLRFTARDLDPGYVARVLEILVPASLENRDIRDVVEGAIISFMFHPETRAVGLSAIDHIGRLLPGRSLEDEFRQLYNTIISDNDRYVQVVSRWLLMPDISIAALRSVLAFAQTSPHRLLPDVLSFSRADERARVRAVRRLLGLCYNGAAIAGFLCELAIHDSTESWALRALSEVLENYLRIEYPAETRRFLEVRFEQTPARSKLRREIARGLKLIREWDEVLRSLPNLKELQPRQEQLVTLNLADRKRNREIGRDVRQRSIFSILANQVCIKQGQGVVTKMPDGTSTITPLRPHSVTFEVPGSEASDPLLGQLRRLRYLSE
ncbi:hypothetical protein [Burkholderia pseudomallei]|uniref:hypothetical protein n=1 Tax=Burkholderia pseudomallei TaxID=28450 RepID=UPI000B08A3BE|nr:hypothetical protein [Burkholderia pseudomallei]